MSAPTGEERELIAELARSALERAAPEELVLFPETADEYFRDPGAVLDPKRRDEAVGFGLDAAMLTPYVLAVATPVVHFLLDAAADSVREEARTSIAGFVRRLLRRGDGRGELSAAGAAESALSAGQVREVRELAYRRARDVGVEERDANLLADAVAGGLVAQSP